MKNQKERKTPKPRIKNQNKFFSQRWWRKELGNPTIGDIRCSAHDSRAGQQHGRLHQPPQKTLLLIRLSASSGSSCRGCGRASGRRRWGFRRDMILRRGESGRSGALWGLRAPQRRRQSADARRSAQHGDGLAHSIQWIPRRCARLRREEALQRLLRRCECLVRQPSCLRDGVARGFNWRRTQRRASQSRVLLRSPIYPPVYQDQHLHSIIRSSPPYHLGIVRKHIRWVPAFLKESILLLFYVVPARVSPVHVLVLREYLEDSYGYRKESSSWVRGAAPSLRWSILYIIPDTPGSQEGIRIVSESWKKPLTMVEGWWLTIVSIFFGGVEAMWTL